MNLRRTINRVQPQMPSGNYQTFGIRARTRRATCIEYGCLAYAKGWQYRIADLDPALYHAATHSGKRFHVVQQAEGESYLCFEAGQSCFAEETHRVHQEESELFIAGRGDYRTFSPRRARRYDRADQWVDDFATNLDNVRIAVERG